MSLEIDPVQFGKMLGARLTASILGGDYREIMKENEARDTQWEIDDEKKAEDEVENATSQEEGLLIVKGNRAWGVTYEDGRETNYGWLPLCKAEIEPECNLERLLRQVGENAGKKELKRAKVVKVRKYSEVTVVSELENES